jgi:hypothetical protein
MASLLQAVRHAGANNVAIVISIGSDRPAESRGVSERASSLARGMLIHPGLAGPLIKECIP